MDFIKEHGIKPGEKLRLKSIETEQTGRFENKEEGRAFTADMNDKIRELQYRLYVEQKQSLLVVLQAPDAAGKDGLIRKVLGRMNPQGCRTYPFKVPSKEELCMISCGEFTCARLAKEWCPSSIDPTTKMSWWCESWTWHQRKFGANATS